MQRVWVALCGGIWYGDTFKYSLLKIRKKKKKKKIGSEGIQEKELRTNTHLGQHLATLTPVRSVSTKPNIYSGEGDGSRPKFVALGQLCD